MPVCVTASEDDSYRVRKPPCSIKGCHAIRIITPVALGANHLTSEGGGWVILKKNILQVHVRKKKFPA